VVAAGAPLLTVGDPDKLEIVVDVLSTDAVKVRESMPVLVENWGGTQPIHAHIQTVEPSGFTKVSALGVEEQRVNIIAAFEELPQTLGDGYRVEARIIVWEQDRVLKAPVSALFRRGSSWRVFVIEGGRAHAREVQVGHLNALEAEIVQGLEEGESVIRHPAKSSRRKGRGWW
jgi:HlyD family secretion protein